MMEKPLDFLRRVIEDNETLVEQLQQAHNDGNDKLARELLKELDSNNADLRVALEELMEVDRPPTSPIIDGRGAAVESRTLLVPF
jgi:hypothetical protein